MLTNNSDNVLYVMGAIFIILILVGLFIRLCTFIEDFASELRYLNREIDRTDGSERRHWIRKRRKLWLSLIPFVKY